MTLNWAPVLSWLEHWDYWGLSTVSDNHQTGRRTRPPFDPLKSLCLAEVSMGGSLSWAPTLCRSEEAWRPEVIACCRTRERELAKEGEERDRKGERGGEEGSREL